MNQQRKIRKYHYKGKKQKDQCLGKQKIERDRSFALNVLIVRTAKDWGLTTGFNNEDVMVWEKSHCY